MKYFFGILPRLISTWPFLKCTFSMEEAALRIEITEKTVGSVTSKQERLAEYKKKYRNKKENWKHFNFLTQRYLLLCLRLWTESCHLLCTLSQSLSLKLWIFLLCTKLKYFFTPCKRINIVTKTPITMLPEDMNAYLISFNRISLPSRSLFILFTWLVI